MGAPCTIFYTLVWRDGDLNLSPSEADALPLSFQAHPLSYQDGFLIGTKNYQNDLK